MLAHPDMVARMSGRELAELSDRSGLTFADRCRLEDYVAECQAEQAGRLSAAEMRLVKRQRGETASSLQMERRIA